jgi:putative transcriptional regulator
MTESTAKKRVWPWFVVFLLGMVAIGITVDLLDIKSKALASGLMIVPMILLIPMVRNAIANARQEGASGDPVRRYLIRMIVVSFAYVGSLFMASQLIESGAAITPLAVLLALIPGIAVSGYFWAIGRLILEQKDEFQRMLIVRQALIATAIALSVADCLVLWPWCWGNLQQGTAWLSWRDNVKNRLKVLRAERDWSQQDLATKLEVSRQSVNAIETGRYDPSLPLAFKIADVFALAIEDIFQRD